MQRQATAGNGRRNPCRRIDQECQWGSSDVSARDESTCHMQCPITLCERVSGGQQSQRIRRTALSLNRLLFVVIVYSKLQLFIVPASLNSDLIIIVLSIVFLSMQLSGCVIAWSSG